MLMNWNQGMAEGARSSHLVLSEPLTFVLFEAGTNFVAVNQLAALGGGVAFFDLGANFRQPRLIFILGRQRDIHVGILRVSTYPGSRLIVKQVTTIRFACHQRCRAQAFGGAA